MGHNQALYKNIENEPIHGVRAQPYTIAFTIY